MTLHVTGSAGQAAYDALAMLVGYHAMRLVLRLLSRWSYARERARDDARRLVEYDRKALEAYERERDLERKRERKRRRSKRS